MIFADDLLADQRQRSHVACALPLSHRSFYLLSTSSAVIAARGPSSLDSLRALSRPRPSYVVSVVSSLLHPAFIYPSTCLPAAALHTLSPATNPSSDDARTRVRFSLSPPACSYSSCTSRIFSTRAFFIYSRNSRTNAAGSITMSGPFRAPC